MGCEVRRITYMCIGSDSQCGFNQIYMVGSDESLLEIEIDPSWEHYTSATRQKCPTGVFTVNSPTINAINKH